MREAKVLVRSAADSAPSVGAVGGRGAVSVVLQVEKDGIVNEEEVYSLVRTAIPELDRTQLSIVLRIAASTNEVVRTPSERLVSFFGLARIASGDYSRLAVVLLGGTVAIAAAGAVLGYWLRGVRMQDSGASGEVRGSVMLAERNDPQLPEV